MKKRMLPANILICKNKYFPLLTTILSCIYTIPEVRYSTRYFFLNLSKNNCKSFFIEGSNAILVIFFKQDFIQ